jgi:hypothetical protein
MLEVRSNVVILAAAKVGGLYGNLMIESKVLFRMEAKASTSFCFALLRCDLGASRRAATRLFIGSPITAAMRSYLLEQGK